MKTTAHATVPKHREGERLLLSSAYLAPVEYYKKMAQYDHIEIEQFDHFEKQTYRNRCRIMTCNQIMDLTIPIIRPKEKCPFKEIKISYQEKWQQTHWRAIESAYNSSPFFEYYRDDFEPFYKKKWDFLIDFNMQIQETTLSLLHLYKKPQLTELYRKKEDLEDDYNDLRKAFHPKQAQPLDLPPYYQVFNAQFGFQPNLSIIDLLFNLGPEGLLYLL